MNIYHRFLGAAIGSPFLCSETLAETASELWIWTLVFCFGCRELAGNFYLCN